MPPSATTRARARVAGAALALLLCFAAAAATAASSAESAPTSRTQLGIVGDPGRFTQLTGQRSSIRHVFASLYQSNSFPRILEQLRPVPMLALKTGAHPATRHRAGPRRLLARRPERRARRLRRARVRPPDAGDERALERVLRLQQGRLVTRRALLDRVLPQGVRADRDLRSRRVARVHERAAAQARPAWSGLRPAADPGADRLEPAGLRRAGHSGQFGGGLLPGGRLRRRGRERHLPPVDGGGVGRERGAVPPVPAQALRDRGVGPLGHGRPRVRRAHGRLRADPFAHGVPLVLQQQAGIALGSRLEAAEPRRLPQADHAARG